MRNWLIGLGFFFVSTSAGIAVMQGQTTWIATHPWIPYVLAVAGLGCWGWSAWPWFRRLGPSPTARGAHLETHGPVSPNITAMHGSTVMFNAGTLPDPSKLTRPWIRPFEYGCRGYAEELAFGPQEFVSIGNDGEPAYEIQIDPLIVGVWTVSFDFVPRLDKGKVARAVVSSIIKGADRKGRLIEAWLDANTVSGPLGKLGVCVHYTDSLGRSLQSVCSIELDARMRFRIFDFADVPTDSGVTSQGGTH